MAVKTVIANVLDLRFLSENRLVVTVLLILLKLSNAQRYSVIRMHPLLHVKIFYWKMCYNLKSRMQFTPRKTKAPLTTSLRQSSAYRFLTSHHYDIELLAERTDCNLLWEGWTFLGASTQHSPEFDPIQSNPIQPNPIHGWIQSMDISEFQFRTAVTVYSCHSKWLGTRVPSRTFCVSVTQNTSNYRLRSS